MKLSQCLRFISRAKRIENANNRLTMLMGLPNRGTLGAHLVAIEKHRASGNMLDIRGNADRTYKYLQPLKVTRTIAFYNFNEAYQLHVYRL